MIKIAIAHGFTTDELAQLNHAVFVANEAIQSDAFGAMVMACENFTCTDVLGKKLSNKEILDLIRSATCGVQFAIQSYYWIEAIRRRKEVAREVDGGGVIFNRKFFDAEYLPDHADTVAHEFTHCLGFTHPFYDTPEREQSVAYQIGTFVNVLVAAKYGRLSQ